MASNGENGVTRSNQSKEAEVHTSFSRKQGDDKVNIEGEYNFSSHMRQTSKKNTFSKAEKVEFNKEASQGKAHRMFVTKNALMKRKLQGVPKLASKVEGDVLRIKPLLQRQKEKEFLVCPKAKLLDEGIN